MGIEFWRIVYKNASAESGGRADIGFDGDAIGRV